MPGFREDCRNFLALHESIKQNININTEAGIRYDSAEDILIPVNDIPVDEGGRFRKKDGMLIDLPPCF